MKKLLFTPLLAVTVSLIFWHRSESSPNSSSHPLLLPEPRQIQFGTGQIPLRGLGIRFGSSPSSEDRFTAADLAAALALRAGTSVPIWEGSGSGKAIVLNRTGPVDPLPLPDEAPGPNSREAYSLKVSLSGVEIQARSSAGLFSGSQTLLQLVQSN